MWDMDVFTVAQDQFGKLAQRRRVTQVRNKASSATIRKNRVPQHSLLRQI